MDVHAYVVNRYPEDERSSLSHQLILAVLNYHFLLFHPNSCVLISSLSNFSSFITRWYNVVSEYILSKYWPAFQNYRWPSPSRFNHDDGYSVNRYSSRSKFLSVDYLVFFPTTFLSIFCPPILQYFNTNSMRQWQPWSGFSLPGAKSLAGKFFCCSGRIISDPDRRKRAQTSQPPLLLLLARRFGSTRNNTCLCAGFSFTFSSTLKNITILEVPTRKFKFNSPPRLHGRMAGGPMSASSVAPQFVSKSQFGSAVNAPNNWASVVQNDGFGHPEGHGGLATPLLSFPSIPPHKILQFQAEQSTDFIVK